MTETEALEKWARTTEVRQPVRWGEVEDAVLARDIPAFDGLGGPQKAVFVLGLGLLYFLAAVLLYGAAIVGLGLVVLGTSLEEDSGPADIILTVSQVNFLGVVACCAMIMFAWVGPRLRGPADLALTGGSGLVSAGAFSILYSSYGVIGRLEIITLVATAAGLVAFGVLLVASRGTRVGLGFALNPENKESRYKNARNRVLRIFRERGVVDVPYDQRMKMIKMPVGSWHELDPRR